MRAVVVECVAAGVTVAVSSLLIPSLLHSSTRLTSFFVMPLTHVCVYVCVCVWCRFMSEDLQPAGARALCSCLLADTTVAHLE